VTQIESIRARLEAQFKVSGPTGSMIVGQSDVRFLLGEVERLEREREQAQGLPLELGQRLMRLLETKHNELFDESVVRLVKERDNALFLKKQYADQLIADTRKHESERDALSTALREAEQQVADLASAGTAYHLATIAVIQASNGGDLSEIAKAAESIAEVANTHREIIDRANATKKLIP